jgi:hypothetical protein
MLDQLPRISLSARRRLAAQVDEIVGVVVSLAHHVVLGVVEDGEELFEETLLAFAGELVVESPEAAAEDGPEAVDVCSRWKPIFSQTWNWGMGVRIKGTYQRATAS